MKICMLTSSFFPYVGGVELAIHHLTKKLYLLGHQVTVLTPVENGVRQGSFPISIPYHIQPLDPFGNKLSSIIDTHQRCEKRWELNLSQEMQRKGFDLLHAHFSYPSGYCAVRWAQHNQVPVVITCHGGDMSQVSKTDGNLHLENEIRPKISYTLQQVDIITVVSRHLMKSVIGAGCPTGKIRLIPNGVNLKPFENTNDYKDNNGFILAMGRFDKVKGFDLLLEAFYQVAKVKQDVKLVIAGFATKKYRSLEWKHEWEEKTRLLDFVLRHHLGQRVRFKPFQFGADKVALLKNCSFLVCPSRMEGFGLVVLEAMAAGKPVVAFNVGGISDIVQSGVNGILVKPYDTNELAQAMLSLLDNPQLQREMSQASQRIASNYGWSAIAQKYVAVYTELLNTN